MGESVRIWRHIFAAARLTLETPGKLPNNPAGAHLVVNYLFREQNTVVKLAMASQLAKRTDAAVKNAFGALRLHAHSHAAVVQQLLQDHEVTAERKGWLSKWI